MNMIEWLSGAGKREALARLDAMIEQRRETERRAAPMYEVASRIADALLDEEKAGRHPVLITLPQSDFNALIEGSRALREASNIPWLAEPAEGLLLGVRVVPGIELRIDCAV